jgi:hypothetical protein
MITMVSVILFSKSPMDSVGFIARLERPSTMSLKCKLNLEPGFDVHPGKLIQCVIRHFLCIKQPFPCKPPEGVPNIAVGDIVKPVLGPGKVINSADEVEC